MDIGDFKTYALAAVPIILLSAPLTYWQLAKGRFRADQTWLMVKLLLIDLKGRHVSARIRGDRLGRTKGHGRRQSPLP